MRTTLFLFLTCGLLVAADYRPGPDARHCVLERAASLSAEEEIARGTFSELARASFWFWRANISDRS